MKRDSVANVTCPVRILPRKEVIQPQVLLRLPCYDFTPLAEVTLGALADDFRYPPLGWCDGRCVQSPSTYSPRYG